jgi:serine/threonine protein kinase
MKSLSLCRELCPKLIPVVPSSQLGDGADGEVFEIEGSTDKVIKFSTLYHYSEPLEKEFCRINEVLSFLAETCPSTYARVFRFNYLGRSTRKTVSGPQEYFLYYYIMEKCFKLSEDEKKVFHSILSHEDRGAKKKYSDQQLQKVLYGLNMGLDFDLKKVLQLCQDLKKTPIDHSDLHPRNIMKDRFGNFKLIDFDRSKLSQIMENKHV